MPQRIIACESDKIAAADFLLGVAAVGMNLSTLNDCDGSTEPKVKNYLLYDNKRFCLSCEASLNFTESGNAKLYSILTLPSCTIF